MREKDMYLPVWVCGLGIFFIVSAIICAVLSFKESFVWVTGTIICLSLGISAILCWRNQWAMVLNNEEFVYSTMFGNKTKYQFSQITELKVNEDSMTLFLKEKKVHIESCAIVSDRFVNLINQSLKRS